MLVLALVFFGSCWTPIFHQYFAEEVIKKHFDNISDTFKESFVLGSIYADGFDKSITHFSNRTIKLINKFSDQKNEEYYFFLGILSHIASDVFAHSGKTKSFIIGKGFKHYLSEIAICSLFLYKFKVIPKQLSNCILEKISQSGLRPLPRFFLFQKVFKYIANFPFWIVLPYITNDFCDNRDYSRILIAFQEHIANMHTMFDFLLNNSSNESISELDIKKITLALQQKIICV